MRSRTWSTGLVLTTVAALFLTAVPADAARKPPRDRIAYVGTDGRDPQRGLERSTPPAADREGCDAASPTWAPSGNQIAYLRVVNGGDFGSPYVYRDLRVMRPNGKGKRTLLTGGQNRSFADLAWAPGGRRIAVTMQNRAESVHDVAIYTVKSRTLVRLRLFEGTDWIPSDIDWSPDGQRLIFSAYQFEVGNPHEIATSELWTVRPNGTGLRQLTNTAALEFAPVWAPDGQRIAYSEGFNCATVVIANADGTPRRRVPGCKGGPDWAPGGGRLVVCGPRLRHDHPARRLGPPTPGPRLRPCVAAQVVRPRPP